MTDELIALAGEAVAHAKKLGADAVHGKGGRKRRSR